MRRAWAVMDLVAVVVFVGIGRSVHAHGLGLAGDVSTAWPFVAGLASGIVGAYAGWLGRHTLGMLTHKP